MAGSEQFSLRWNNFHSNLTSGFHELLEASDMVDVTLSVEGQFLQAHKLVLSICSPLFKQLFKINPCKHPVIILRDVTYSNIKDILEFMYLGEVNVLRDNLTAFLRTAEVLQVKGLTGDDSSETSSKKDEKPDSLCDNDLEQDIQQFNQFIKSSDSPPQQRYSAPRLPSPPPAPTPLISNTKRPLKNSYGTFKRQKSDINRSSTKTSDKQERSSTPNQFNEDDSDYVQSSNLKVESIVYGSEGEDSPTNKEVIKQLLESNNVNLSSMQDAGVQDQDGLLYSVDSKGHVYCPYCYRKFVNRYNLKVHVRDKHDHNPINLDCVVCGKTMRNRSCLRVHLYHHRKQQQAFQVVEPQHE